jgi:hypothetical protein
VTTILPDLLDGWLVGANGLHHSLDGSQWSAAGGGGHLVTDLVRQPSGLLCATLAGVWQVSKDSSQWLQLHDETLTEVFGIALRADQGLVAVSPYGLAFSQPAEHGATRWRSRADGLRLNERFSNALLAHPDVPGDWVVGTEDGVRIYGAHQDQWRRTELSGLPCRALLHAHGFLWAGTDGGGIWRSEDGDSWRRAGTGLDSDSVFSLCATEDRLLAGTLRGICSGDGDGAWQRSGPSLLVSAVAAQLDGAGAWLAGANPGGLWCSHDSGKHWRQVGEFDTVRAIMAPERTV